MVEHEFENTWEQVKNNLKDIIAVCGNKEAIEGILRVSEKLGKDPSETEFEILQIIAGEK